MKAVYFNAYGGPEVLEYGEQPDPVAEVGEVVIDVHAASVNAADWKVRQGNRPPNVFPQIPGRDFSGVVAQLGENVADFAIGDEVFGVLERPREGAYAEKLVMAAEIIAKKPESVSHVEAAALALTGLTALVSIEDTLKLKSGESILIQGGAGGVASFAIQLAKHIGAHVITTASPRNFDYVSGLGADEVIDYNAVDFTDVVSGVDAVFDTVGGDVADRAYDVLRKGGRAAFIGSGSKIPEPPHDAVTGLLPNVVRDRRHLDRIMALVGDGVVRIPEITTYTLDQAVDAHRESEARHVRGKLVFVVR